MPTEGRLTESMASPMSPLMNRRTTLKDALSMLLDADVQAGIVVDRAGAALGLVTVGHDRGLDARHRGRRRRRGSPVTPEP